jgi:hypothetical protein
MITGISYPIQIENGNLKLVSDEDLYQGHILSLLETRPFERVMLPGYFTPDQLFQSYDQLVPDNTKLELILTRWIPQCVFTVKSQYSNNGEVAVSIYWSVPSISNQENLIRVIW